jgi:cytochrome c biogenesis protein
MRATAPRRTAPPEAEPGRELSIGELFARIYQLFYSKTVGLLLILAMAVLVLLGVVIGQAPPGVHEDEASRAAFVEQAAQTYGGWAGVLDVLGLFRVFTSPAFVVVVVLLGLSIVACTTHRIPTLWRRYRHPRTHVGARFFDRARYRATVETAAPAEQTLAAVHARLRASRYRVRADPDDPHALYADRHAWGGVGTVVAHAGFLLVMLAFALSSSGGIDDSLPVPVGGDPVEVGHGTGLRVSARSFDARYDESGRPLDYVSRLVVEDSDGGAQERDVRVNQPLRHEGVRFHQAGFGVAADVRVAGPDGEPWYAGSVPLGWTSQDGTLAVGAVPLPGHGVEVEVFVPASGASGAELAAGQAAFRLIPEGRTEATASVTVEQGTPGALDDLTVLFEREREYTGISVRQDPGAPWMWTGSIFLIVGMTVTFACRHRRVWLRVEGAPTRVRLASSDKQDPATERKLQELAHDLASALHSDSGSHRKATP